MENKQRLINGKAMLQRVDAEAADHVMASLDRVAPDVAKLILEFGNLHSLYSLRWFSEGIECVDGG